MLKLITHVHTSSRILKFPQGTQPLHQLLPAKIFGYALKSFREGYRHMYDLERVTCKSGTAVVHPQHIRHDNNNISTNVQAVRDECLLVEMSTLFIIKLIMNFNSARYIHRCNYEDKKMGYRLKQ